MDKMNRAILAQLRDHGRCSWQKIGQKVHLTGQAVAARVQAMQDAEVIRRFTVDVAFAHAYFITMYMHSEDFTVFEALLRSTEPVQSAHKVTGEGCYHVYFASNDAQDLELFLNRVLPFAQYKVLTCVRPIK